MKIITENHITKFQNFLIEEEKSESTIKKYVHDVQVLYKYMDNKNLQKSDIVKYKGTLCKKYASKSVNACLSSINAFFNFMGWYDLKVKTLKIQKQIFLNKEKELTKTEYEQLLETAKSKKNERLYHLMLTIASTGLRISELKFVTCESVNEGQATINCKGKIRQIFFPKNLCKILSEYAKKQNIKSGSLFVSKSGKPLNRSNIWKMMKNLCDEANVSKDKVFPHNFRHLFARTYYSLQKDIVRLADILGHTSVNTTRIYTMESGDVHKMQIEKLGLVPSEKTKTT